MYNKLKGTTKRKLEDDYIVFNVRVNCILDSQFVGIIGNIPELGNWYLTHAVKMDKEEIINGKEIWTLSTKLHKKECHIEYRYFIGEYTTFHNQEKKVFFKVVTWEESVHPRKIQISKIDEESVKKIIDTYGIINGSACEHQGWAIDETEVILRLTHSSLTWCVPFEESKNIEIYLRCFYCDLPQHSIFDNSSSIAIPEQKTADVSKLSEGEYIRQKIPFKGIRINSEDYINFYLETENLCNLSVKIEVHIVDLDTSDKTSRLVGSASCVYQNSDAEIKSLAVISAQHGVVASLKADFLVIKPFDYPSQMKTSFKHYWNRRGILKIGHRGTGTTSGEVLPTIRENTISSLITAGKHGADYIEFDVHLSKDKVPVVFHNFSVLTTLRKIDQDVKDIMEIPVKDLTVGQLQSLQLYDSVTEILEVNTDECQNVEPENMLFPTLLSCLSCVHESVGFDIELKYPQAFKDGEHEMRNYYDRNTYVDTVLEVVLKNHGKRRLIFSSFDADLCTIFNRKQNKLPIVFLTQGDSQRYEAYLDPRTQTIEKAIYFSLESQLLGLSVNSEALLEDMSLINFILEHSLVLFVWGQDLNDPECANKFTKYNLHGLIVDKIDQRQSIRQNVFALELLTKLSSRRASIEK